MECSADSIRSLSKEEINGLPLLAYGGDVRLVSNAGALDDALDLLREDSVLGSTPKPGLPSARANRTPPR